MRVACIGNTNSRMFAITRYLRDRGVDAHLLLLNVDLPHFHPTADAYDFGFRDYTHTLAWGNHFRIGSSSEQEIRSSLEGFDFLIASGTAPAFIHKAGRSVDMFVPAGDDIRRLPFLRGRITREVDRRVRRFANAQRAAIQGAAFISAGPSLVPAIARLGVEDQARYLPTPAVYDGIHHPDRIGQYAGRSALQHEFQRVRERFDTMVLHHSRLIWRDAPDDASSRGNDKAIRAFARLCESRPGANAGLVLFELGEDVWATGELVSGLGLSDRVEWFPATHRRDIMPGLALADVCLGQFGHPGEGGCAGDEALAMGRPLVQWCGGAGGFIEATAEQPPLFDAKTVDEIAAALETLVDEPDRARDLGRSGLAWHEKFVAGQAVDRYVELIDAKARGEAIRDVVAGWPGRVAAR